MIQDYYQLLRISPHATAAEIRKAFRREAKKVHPDFYQSSSTQEQQKQQKLFILLTQGYEILMDPEHRRKYDDQYKKFYEKEWQKGQQKNQPNTSYSSGQQQPSPSDFQQAEKQNYSSKEEASLDSLLHDVENLLNRFGFTFRDPVEILVDWARRVFQNLTETWNEEPPSSEEKGASRFSRYSPFEDIEAELKNLKRQYGSIKKATTSGEPRQNPQKSDDLYVEIEKELERLKKKYQT